MRRAATPLLLALLGLGCSNPGKPFHYPLDTVLRLDDVQLKATHNSYHVETSDIPEWEYTHAAARRAARPARACARSSSTCTIWLNDDRRGLPLRGLSRDRRRPGHHLPAVRRLSAHHQALVRSLSRPPAASTSSSSPRTASSTPWPSRSSPTWSATSCRSFRASASSRPTRFAAAPRRRCPRRWPDGWPTLDQLRGRVFFGFDNRDDVRAAYTHDLQDLNGRLSLRRLRSDRSVRRHHHPERSGGRRRRDSGRAARRTCWCAPAATRTAIRRAPTT